MSERIVTLTHTHNTYEQKVKRDKGEQRSCHLWVPLPDVEANVDIPTQVSTDNIIWEKEVLRTTPVQKCHRTGRGYRVAFTDSDLKFSVWMRENDDSSAPLKCSVFYEYHSMDHPHRGGHLYYAGHAAGPDETTCLEAARISLLLGADVMLMSITGSCDQTPYPSDEVLRARAALRGDGFHTYHYTCPICHEYHISAVSSR